MFEFLVTIFDFLLYQPLLNGLILIYNILPIADFGLAVIILTLIIKLILYPLSVKSIKSQKQLQELQPQIASIQEKFKNDQLRQAQEIMKLYKKAGISPFSGCLPLLIQLPILIAIYRVFWNGVHPDKILPHLYPFVHLSGPINYNFFGIIDLSQPFWPLALATALAQYFQTKVSFSGMDQTKIKDNQFAKIFQKQAVYIFPLVTLIIFLTLPSALALYLLITTVFTIFQQYTIYKKIT